MLEGKTVAVVVPAFNEERSSPRPCAGSPRSSTGSSSWTTARRTRQPSALAEADPRVEVIRHEENLGVGAAIVTGYQHGHRPRDRRHLRDGRRRPDGPDDLERLSPPSPRGECDYAKANRLFTGQAWELIPRSRYIGNAVLSFLTKIASGYWHVADSQSGYTAVNLETLRLLDLERLYPVTAFPTTCSCT